LPSWVAAKAQREAEDALFAGLTTEQRDELRELLIALRDSHAPETRDACESPASDVA
jgi:hypothetical protein